MTRVIGLMSGTSIDGIDAALVEIAGSTHDLQVHLIAGETYPYSSDLRQQVLAVCGGAPLSMAELAELDDRIAYEFANAAIALQAEHLHADLIGSHGQTVYHRPPRPPSSEERKVSLITPALGYSLQLGRGASIAAQTGITTISNFRAADIAAGGQGAPLVPAVDAWLLRHPTLDRCVQNLGGIGNVTYLPATKRAADSSILGWDTGPANLLLDLAVQQLSNGAKTYDKNGEWAASGTPYPALVDRWLQHAFFQTPPPKSTGRELFGLPYLQQCMTDAKDAALSDADFLATLTEFTAGSIADSYRRFLPHLPDQVLLCGGGSKNEYLKQRIQRHLSSVAVLTTDDVDISADFKEAIAFAVLAYWREQGIPGNLPDVTGAKAPVCLGEIYPVDANAAC
ncbi:anhydro-N-acetylmuramic acid kinase [Leptolyngbya sp. FACHB-36]|uniref:anhydro-N-acetylmuramic acid kinase n=1 Tax=Leptolyngbya sp. FACHB-36 TaxID=2692808 RepID=UPI0016813DED|nr:anhydro-N-acetylmuramic acid kinase [Leptolyngbya sp. FACHB-36]MBD2018796.1 anhydro-N-acetylmuramic acid kinase [Leptolyngbya sp. FACHB-36]